MSYLRKIFAIVAKDVAAELRTREMLSSMFVFSLLVILIFNFAFDLRAENQKTLAPGVLWVAIAFSGMLGLSRSFIMEKDRGSMEGLLLTPVDRSAIYLGKMLGNFLFISIVAIIILPVFIVLFNLSAAHLPQLAGVVAVHTRAREVLLPILLFPVVIPVMLAAVKLTAAVLDGTAFADVQNWFSLLVAFDLIFLALSFMLFDYVMEE
jgi:heme exporter protein B